MSHHVSLTSQEDISKFKGVKTQARFLVKSKTTSTIKKTQTARKSMSRQFPNAGKRTAMKRMIATKTARTRGAEKRKHIGSLMNIEITVK